MNYSSNGSVAFLPSCPPAKKVNKIAYPTNSIKTIQNYVQAKIDERGFSDETIHERLLLLTEAVGELVKAVRKVANMNVSAHSKTHSVEEELADVLNMLFAVAIELKVDLEVAHKTKEAEIDKRVYKRSNDKL